MIKECAEFTGLDQKVAKQLLVGDYTNRSPSAKVFIPKNGAEVRTNVNNFQCFVRCLFKKEGFINDKDEPQLEFIAESLQDTIKIKRKRLDAILKICTKARDVDPCEAAFNVSWFSLKENLMPKFFSAFSLLHFPHQRQEEWTLRDPAFRILLKKFFCFEWNCQIKFKSRTNSYFKNSLRLFFIH